MLNRGVQMKRKLWSQAGQQAVRDLTLEGRAAQRRKDLLHLLASLDEQIRALDQVVEKAATENPAARLLMTQPGVGPITALAFVLTMGDATRFHRGKQVASYLGFIDVHQATTVAAVLDAHGKLFKVTDNCDKPFVRVDVARNADCNISGLCIMGLR
jgi:transposase